MAETTHRKISRVWLVVAALFAAVVLISLAELTQRAAAQEPTPTISKLTPPAAPELLGVDERVTWIDHSDNEDGFRVYITVDGRENVFEVGPNVTAFEFPEGLLPECGHTRYRLSAFNQAGERRSATNIAVVTDCAFAPTTPQPKVLPETGSGGPDALPYALVLAALAGAAGLTLISAAVLSVRRR